MRPGVIACPREASLPTLAGILAVNGIHAVVVPPLNGDTPLVVTALELVRGVVERAEGANAGLLAREAIETLPADATLAQAVELMAVRYVRHVLAMDPAAGEPVGIVSSLDVAALVGGIQPQLARVQRPGPARPSPSIRRLGEGTAAEVMHSGIVTCPPDASLRMVARMMAEHRLHCVGVAGVDSTRAPGQRLTWGLIEDIDLILAVHGGHVGAPAATIASASPPAVRQGDSPELVARLMVEHGTSHVVVVSADGLPTGIISTLDIASLIAATG